MQQSKVAANEIMKGYRETLFQNEGLSTRMGHPDSCAVSALRQHQTLAGKGHEQPGLTLKVALHGSGDQPGTADEYEAG